VPDAQRFALAALYGSAGGDVWAVSDQWLVSNSVCTWYGILCSGNVIT
jgi:hypothetical protein